MEEPSPLGPGHEIFVLGPDTYFHAVTFTLYGYQIVDKTAEVIARIREGLDQTNGLIMTYREEWCDSFVHRDPECRTKSLNREPLYAEGKVQHWYASPTSALLP